MDSLLGFLVVLFLMDFNPILKIYQQGALILRQDLLLVLSQMRELLAITKVFLLAFA